MEKEGMDIVGVLLSLNTVLILLGTGLIVFLIRLLVPDNVEETKAWKTFLRILPILVGAGIAFIPGLRPTSVFAQCAIIGGVVGSLASSTYDVLTKGLGDKFKALIGSPQQRKRMSSAPPKPE